MLHYPKIPSSEGCPGGRCIAFEKYDGTNLHWDWDRDFGWHSFGTRRDSFDLPARGPRLRGIPLLGPAGGEYPSGRQRFDAAHPGLEEAVDVFWATIAAGFEAVFVGHETYRPL